MRLSLWMAATALAGLVGWTALAQSAPTGGRVQGQAAVSFGAPGLITHFNTADGRPTSVTVIDPQTKVMSVYFIGRETGQIQLKSVRPLRYDMEMTSFNTGDPSPEDIRQGLARRP